MQPNILDGRQLFKLQLRSLWRPPNSQQEHPLLRSKKTPPMPAGASRGGQVRQGQYRQVRGGSEIRRQQEQQELRPDGV